MKKKIRNGGLKKKYMYIEINLFIQYISEIILIASFYNFFSIIFV